MNAKKPIVNPALQTWIGLNEALRAADEKECIQLLAEETRGRKRGQFMLRIHSRMNYLRAVRERAAIQEKRS